MIDPNDSIQVPIVVGLTIRQYFAAQAMIGILSAEEPRSLADRHYTYRAFQQCAHEAVLQADALIAELNLAARQADMLIAELSKQQP